MPLLLRSRAAVATAAVVVTHAVLAALAPASARAEPGALVWPARPDLDVSGADRAVAEAGYRGVDFAPIARRLAVLGAQDRAAVARVFDRAEQALGAARAAYLEQRFDDMVTALTGWDDASLEVLARPESRALAWELWFQLGLAHWSRKQPGDADEASRRFALAIALDGERRPDRAVYGPDVVNAFGAALGGLTAIAPRPVAIAVTPADARVVIDGAVVLADRESGELAPTLRPGLHLVHASAPGYASRGMVVEVGRDGTLPVSLARREAGEAGEAGGEGGEIDRLGAAWARGELRAHTATGQALLLAIARGAGADVVVVVDADGGGTYRARAVRADGSGVAGAPASATTAGVAVARALATPVAAGAVPGASPNGGRRGKVPAYKRWWFWTLVGAGAVLAGVSFARLREQRARLQIFVRE